MSMVAPRSAIIGKRSRHHHVVAETGRYSLFASPEQGGQIENVQARYEANVATGMEEAIAMQAVRL